MKRFIIRIVAFFVILFVIDRVFGYAFKYLQEHPKGGETGRLEYIADKMNDEMLIFGSSRAYHHYDPLILRDSLYLSVFNCGQKSNGIIFSYSQYTLFKDRFKPKVIIYDIYDGYDLLVTPESNEKYISALREYYDRPGIDSIFYKINPTERYKMLPYMRWYNQKFIQIVMDYLNDRTNTIKGYKPLHGVMEYKPIENITHRDQVVYDSLKLYYWQRLFEETASNETKIILMVSPFYGGGSTDVLKPLIEMAANYEIPFIDCINDSNIVNDKSYFIDSSHLNNVGAEKYTSEIVDTLRKVIKR